VIVVFSLLENTARGPQQPLRMRCGGHGLLVVTGKIARLQLADPITALLERRRRVVGKTTFDREFLELRAVEAAESRRQSAECANQRKLRSSKVELDAEMRLVREGDAQFGFALRVAERVARRHQMRVQRAAGVVGISEITDPIRGFERAA